MIMMLVWCCNRVGIKISSHWVLLLLQVASMLWVELLGCCIQWQALDNSERSQLKKLINNKVICDPV